MNGNRRRLLIVAVVALLFAGIVAAKMVGGSAGPVTERGPGTAASLTSVRNDAGADFEAALKAGKPIYVLFHSLTCKPCVEISAVADGVLPDYQDKITFVNAITDDPSAQRLASRFQFQYIPTSFFLKSDGTVSDSFTGPMSEAGMRGRLDALAGAR